MVNTMFRSFLYQFAFAIFAFSGGSLSKRFLVPTPPLVFPNEAEFPFLPNDLNKLSKDDTYGLAWERSGLFEGDIVTTGSNLKNIVSSPAKRWTMPIPVFINGSDFDGSQLAVIEKALTELEEMTCVRFRQYKADDSSFITVRGNDKGCWSMVGRRDGGQIVHLQKPACVHHGIVVHEFLHALGLYHQQSSPDRDQFVTIHWDNIASGREHNFNKYSTSEVTTYNLTYDYQSVMHYSAKAFSSNGEPTITPKVTGAEIGQRQGLSELDANKVRIMYNCPNSPSVPPKKPVKDIDEFDWDLEDLFSRLALRTEW